MFFLWIVYIINSFFKKEGEGEEIEDIEKLKNIASYTIEKSILNLESEFKEESDSMSFLSISSFSFSDRQIEMYIDDIESNYSSISL